MNNEPPLKNIPLKPTRLLFWAKLVMAVLVLIGVVFLANYFYPQPDSDSPTETSHPAAQTNNIYITFTNEIYDKIQTHYWNQITHQQLSNLYKLAAEKITQQPVAVFFNDQNGVNGMLRDITQDMDTDQKKEFIVNLNNIVLANLEPFNRGGLFSQKQAADLKNRVSNVDPDTDLFEILDADKDSSPAAIQEKYEQRQEELNQIIQDETKTEEAKQQAQQQLALADRAYETLGSKEKKERYAESGVESSVNSRLITPEIFYLHLKIMSPTSFEEFQHAANAVDDQPPSLNTFILDLRGNVGGSVDLMQWFLGPFIGPNNLAYEFYHQEEYESFKTVVGWLPSLVRYKKVIILIDDQTQSSAEVMAATLKKYNVGILIGQTTKGWGTIEQIFPLDNQIDATEKYSMFLVHSLTLRNDNQPIEGRGVDPHINIESDNWPDQLSAYFNYPELITVIQELWDAK